MKIWEAVIPGVPPSVNHLYKTGRAGRRFLTKEGERFKNKAREVFKSQWMFEPSFDPQAPYTVEFRFYLAKVETSGWKTGKAKNRFVTKDLTNLVKVIEDVLSDMTGVNDRNHFDVTLRKRKSSVPRIEIEVKEFEGEFQED